MRVMDVVNEAKGAMRASAPEIESGSFRTRRRSIAASEVGRIGP